MDSGKTLVQCDFDGTVTEEDVSFLLLDAFAPGDWRKPLADYRQNKISVDCFNRQAFALVKAGRKTLAEFLRGRARLRRGFRELVDCCRQKGFRPVIVSNGLKFYIDILLGDAGITGIEVFAAQTRFRPRGIEVRYIGPDGEQAEKGLKELYARLFLSRGYRLIYLGNGVSDIYPARLAHYVFARDDLLSLCARENVPCTPFADLNDVVRGLELLPPP